MNNQPNQTSSTQPTAARGVGIMQLALVVAILGVAILLTALTADVTKASEPGVRLVNGQPYLPDVVGDWTGGAAEGLTEQERKQLPADTAGVRRRYIDPQGHEVTCSIVLAGRDVTSIHRPEICLPAQGWNIQMEQVEVVRAATAPGGQLKVMRMDAVHSVAMGPSQQPLRAIFIYWFVGKERITPHHWERILWTMKDRILHNRNHRWAYILIAAPVRPEQGPEAITRAQAAAMEVQARFVERLYPALHPLANE